MKRHRVTTELRIIKRKIKEAKRGKDRWVRILENLVACKALLEQKYVRGTKKKKLWRRQHDKLEK